MPSQPWEQVLDGNVDTINGVVNTTGAEALIFPDKTIPAFYMVEGRKLRGRVRFKYSNPVTTPGNITFRVRWGGLAGTILAQTSAIALNIVAQTDIMGVMDFDIDCRVRGLVAVGSLLCMGEVRLAAELAASNNAINFMGSAGGASTNTPAAVLVTTVVDTLLSVTYQSSVATASMTGMMYTLELLN
jgi:hypothetical protein